MSDFTPSLDELRGEFHGLEAEFDRGIDKILADAKQEVTDLLDEIILQKNRAISAVRELHRKDDKECATCRDAYGDYLRYPCPTIQALDGDM